MDSDDQKTENKNTSFLTGCQLNGSHVLSPTGIRSAVQDALRLHWELLGYRYHILLSIRGILAVLLLAIQIFKN